MHLKRRIWVFIALVSAIATAIATVPMPGWAQPAPKAPGALPPAVMRHYPEPTLAYETPGLRPGRQDLTSHDEALAYLRQLAARNALVKLEAAGTSQQGRDIPLVLLFHDGQYQPGKPTVLVVAQQHGNEPAGGEAALALAQQLSSVHSKLLESVNVLILPRANPDGAENFVRATANGLDVNRDHLLLQTPEGRAIANIALRFVPQVVMDLHEFTVGGRWLDKFGAFARYDALLQAATVGNLDPHLGRLAEREFVGAARSVLEANGLATFWYHTSSSDVADKVVSMGGVQPDTGRNVYGLRNAVSLLIETRGVGIGRLHYARRVNSHVLATLAVIQTAATQGSDLVQVIAAANRSTGGAACHGSLVVQARATPARENLEFVDAKSGEIRTETVEWRSALALQVGQTRPRPCGYWLGKDQVQTIEKLRLLGAEVRPIAQERRGVPVETYTVLRETGGQRADARGSIAAERPIRDLTVATEAGQRSLPAGSWYVSMYQPLASLVAAALEPDSQNSYVANHVLDLSPDALMRVMRPLPD